MILRQDEYIWAVTFISPDDGHRCTAAYFTSQQEAHVFSHKKTFGDDQRVVQTTLWKDDSNNFYEVRYTPIEVDKQVHIRNALKKLSYNEKQALGIKENI